MFADPRRPGGQPVRILVGPTGVGKSAVALALARALGAEIISADSRQVYRGLSAGTAKPEGEWRDTAAGRRYVAAGVAHHLVDVADPTEPFTAGRFVKEAAVVLSDLARRGTPAIIVGGTGPLPPIVGGVGPCRPGRILRRSWEELAAARGRDHVHALLSQVDPVAARAIPANNLQRVLRALEVHARTGRPLSDWQAKETRPAEWDFEWTGLVLPPEVHRVVLTARCAAMAPGVLKECAALLAAGISPDAPAFQSLGYREGAVCVRGGMSRVAFEAAFLRQTLLYVKTIAHRFRAEPVRWWTVTPAAGYAAAIADEMRPQKVKCHQHGTRAVVGVWAKGAGPREEASLAELKRLLETAGGTAVAEIIQERARPDPATLMGRGKAEEIANLARQARLSAVVVDAELSPTSNGICRRSCRPKSSTARA
ncbi:MAG: tRNA (adenosine(37)-N6)-dimethylallyltransferase MiaA [Elusimicrobia bacterium]|nr:tRNA (adenosine(37)-N6)-dimethylallyltransferase MiaA [Elusimicrobiota bacterium]